MPDDLDCARRSEPLLAGNSSRANANIGVCACKAASSTGVIPATAGSGLMKTASDSELFGSCGGANLCLRSGKSRLKRNKEGMKAGISPKTR